MQDGPSTELRAAAVCIYQRYLPPDVSGAGRQALTLAKSLRALGYDVWLMGDAPLTRTRHREIEGIPFYPLSQLPSDASRPATVLYWLRATIAVYIHRNDFDALHIHAIPLLNPFIVIFCRFLGKAVIVRSSLEGEFEQLRASRMRSMWKHTLALVNTVVAISRQMKTECERAELGNPVLTYIPNGVDVARFCNNVSDSYKNRMKRRLGIAQQVVLIYHGVFTHRKRLLWAIDAIEDYLVEHEWHLVLIGKPARDQDSHKYDSQLRQRVTTGRLAEHVTIIPYRRKVEMYLNMADGYLLPSVGEGMANALLEAMASGIPPIASRTSGTDDLVEDEYSGLLFTAGDRQDLIECLRRFEKLRMSGMLGQMGRHAQEMVRKHYSIEATARAYGDLYGRGRQPRHGN